ncbi:MAG: AraC family transcriptional regulator ligand-binding domain-containing protein [Burkholderiales bacterium]|nr:AraC family transcriptional regulator ligand-binding domain-containing protein [Burkholderiales bacterium]
MRMDHPVAYQRAGPIAGLRDLLGEFGVSPERVTEGLDIDLDTLAHDTRIRFAEVLMLLQRTVDATGCAHVGLLLGSRYRWSSHGLIFHLAMTAPTLRRALLDFVTWQLGYSSGASAYLYRLGDDYFFGYGIYDRSGPGSRQVYELGAGFGAMMIRDLTGGQVGPQEILFCHDAPSDISAHVRMLKVPVRFNQNQCCLVISGRSIDHPLPGADAEKHRNAQQTIHTALGLALDSSSARLRRAIRPQLLRADPSMAGAARAVGLHPRTLRRHLAAEGLTFEGVRDDVRFVVARELLGLTDLPIGEISAALAFSTHSAFVEAFRRWSGTTPTAWRRQHGNRARPRP